MHYESEKEIEAVVHGFESCTTSKEDFIHHSHLTVAVWYLTHTTPQEALVRMRTGLLRFLDHHGVGRAKYHETLTVFWIKLVQLTISAVDEGTSLVDTTNAVIDSLTDSRVVFDYYSPECLWSAEGARTWLEPNLKRVDVDA